MGRFRTIVVVAALLAFVAGCDGPGPGKGPDVSSVDTRMPLTVDYNDHQVRHPVPHYATGRVDPEPTGVGRSLDFGPEPAADPQPEQAQPPPVTADETKPHAPAPAGRPPATTPPSPSGPVSDASPAARADLFAALAEVRGKEPVSARDFLALAKRRKTKAASTDVSKTETAEPDGDATGDDLGTETADNRDVEGHDSGYRLNFEDAEVKDVMQAVLGNVLGLSYSLAPNVSGRITIASTAPQNRAELLSTLETALSMQGLSLTRTGAGFRIAPLTLGGGTLDGDGAGSGFGISVVPLQYSSVASMNKLLSGFVVETDGIKIDSSRNTVIIRGPGPRRSEIVRAIKAFDGDWMHKQSVSMFELRRARPDDVIGELTRVFDSEKDGDLAGVIEFKAVKRLRSIMVISKNDTLIHRAGAWIRRLDHEDTSETSSIFVYRPRYRDARELTKLVNGLFGNGSSGTDSNDAGRGGVAFQSGSQNGTSGSSSGFGGSSGFGSSSGGFGSSSGGSSSGGVTTASFGSGGGLGSGSGGASLGAGNSGGGGSGGSAFGSLGGSGGSGLKGELADPVDAGEGQGRGNTKLKLTADASNNTVVAYTDGETYSKVQAVLRQLDLPPLQVAVNVIIAEVQLNDELKYGVQFFLNQSQKSVGSIGFSTSSLSPTSILSSAAGSVATGVSTGVTSPIANAISPGAGTGLNFISGGQSSPNIILSALDSISKVHILSTPSIVVMENKPATLEVGNEVPVTTQQAQSNLTADAPTVNSVSYVDTGIILKIIPRIGQNGSVDMQIDQEISSVVPDATGSTSGSLTPTISKRRISSDISVKSGQNVLLAGLVTDTRSKSNGQVPFVGPQLGNLLGNTDNVVSRDELVMFIRPVIVRDSQDAVEVTQDFKRGLTGIDLHGQPVYKP